MSPIVGVVLAGGLARRMGGGDKGLIVLQGRPILDHVIERLGSQVDQIVINANGDPGRLAGYELPIVADAIEGFAGPLAGVLSGMEWAARHCPGADWIVTAATDTPFFPRDLVARFGQAVEAARADMACAASGGRRHPVFGLWPVALGPDLSRAMAVDGVRKVDLWTARHRLAVAEYAVEPYDPFFNVNRPDDVAEAERIAQDHIATGHRV
jgi:molybdopterin-guanine dinucleotide biosynthesis protein A